MSIFISNLASSIATNAVTNGSSNSTNRSLTVDITDSATIDAVTDVSVLKNSNFNNLMSREGQFQWARTVDGTNFDQGNAIATDSSGNVYVTGYYNANAGISNGNQTVYTFAAVSNQAAFIIKFDVTGAFQWARHIDGVNNDSGTSIAVDSNGSVYITGLYNTTGASVYLYNGSTVLHTLPTVSANGIFIIKLDTSGTFLWSRAIDGTGNDLGNGIATDTSGNVYLTGYHAGNATLFGAGLLYTYTFPTTTSQTAFIVKFDTSGAFQWVRTVDGGSGDQGYGIATDMNCNVYITGIYTTNANIMNGLTTMHTLPTASSVATFIVKLDTNGAFQWARTIDGTSNETGTGIATDASGNVYTNGWYVLTPTVFNGLTPLHMLPSASNFAAFIVKFDTTGAFQWARTIDGSGSDQGAGIAADRNGNVYITGLYNGSANVLDGTNVLHAITAASSGGQAAYIIKLDTSGAFQWIRTVDAANADAGTGIATDAIGNLYVCGNYTGTANVLNGTAPVHTLPATSNNGLGGFILSFTAGGLFRRVTPYTLPANGVATISPLPEGRFGWSRILDNISNDQGNCIATDSSGNVYMAGFYTGSVAGTILLNGVTTVQTLPTTQSQGAFFIKFDATGTLQWVRTIDGTSTDQGLGIATDVGGNVYVAGVYAVSSANLLSGTTVLYTFPTALSSTQAAFIIKLDTYGVFYWARIVDGSTSNDLLNGIATDPTGNVYITGSYNANATVLSGPATPMHYLPTVSGLGAFIIKFDTIGAFQWARVIDGTSSDQGTGITSDSIGNVYITGFYNASATVFNASTPLHTLPTASSQAAFIVKLDTLGAFQWARTVDGTGSEQGNGIASDSSGNVYITGFYNTNATIFNASTPLHALPYASGQATFIVKLDTSGAFQWARAIDSGGVDEGRSIAADSSGNVYVTGYYTGTCNMVSTTTTVVHTFLESATQAAYIVKVDTNGGFLWARTLDGTGVDQGNGIATDLTGNVYITGSYTGNANLLDGTSIVHTLPTVGNQAAFIIQLAASGFATDVAPNPPGKAKYIYHHPNSNSATATVNVTGLKGETVSTYRLAPGAGRSFIWLENNWVAF